MTTTVNGKAQALSSLRQQVNDGELNDKRRSTIYQRQLTVSIIALTTCNNQVNDSETGLSALNSDITSLGLPLQVRHPHPQSALYQIESPRRKVVSLLSSAGYVVK